MTPIDEREDLVELDRMLDGLAAQMASRVRHRDRRRRAARRASLVLALSTVAAAILVGRDPVEAPAREPSLDIASSRPFAVFPTSRSDMTVIWLLSPEEP